MTRRTREADHDQVVVDLISRSSRRRTRTLADVDVLIAANDVTDPRHSEALGLLGGGAHVLVVTPVLSAAAGSLRPSNAVELLAQLEAADADRVELDDDDWHRVGELLGMPGMTLPRASIIAVAERLGIDRVASFDARCLDVGHVVLMLADGT